MKRMMLFLCLLGMGVGVFAQKYTEIRGKVKGDNLKQINLYRTENGDMKLQAMTLVASDGSYGFSFCPETAGFYSLGEEKGVRHIIYIKGGELINIDLEDTKAVLTGKNTKENVALYKWEAYSSNLRLKSVYIRQAIPVLGASTYEDFFPELEKIVAEFDSMSSKIKSGNAEFDSLLHEKMRYDLNYYAMQYLFTPRTKHPQRSDWPKFYDSIVRDDIFNSDIVFQFPLGERMIQAYVQMAYALSGKPFTGDIYEELGANVLKTDRLKGEFFLNFFMRRYTTYEQYLQGMKKYAPYLVTLSLKQRAEAIGTQLYSTRTGGVAADFTYPDVDGKSVSLSDFKGKVVLIDVWATWCMPCRMELPHLKRLEEEMHGKDVVFIGVSLEEAKDKQKWLDFVKKEGLKGIQLHAGGWSKIAQDYQIKGIPRFIVIDKKGNVVSADAPRPSTPDLKRLLEIELKK